MDHLLWKRLLAHRTGEAGPGPEDLPEFARLFLFRGMVESIGLAVVLNAPDGRILYVNPAYERLFGLSSDPHSRTGSYRDHPTHGADAPGDIAIPAPEDPGDEVVEAFDFDGNAFPLWRRVETIHDATGAKLLTFTFMHRVGTLPAPSPDTREGPTHPRPPETNRGRIACHFTPDGTLTFVSDAFCSFFGKSREELLGTSFFTLVPQTRSEDFRRRLHHSARTHRRIVSVGRTVGADGRLLWHQWSHQTIHDGLGEPVGFQSVALDITSREQALQEIWQAYAQMDEGLRRHAEVLDCLFEDNEEVILVMDYDTLDIVDANPSACRFYGYGREQMRGMSLLTINPEPTESLRAKRRLVVEGRENRFLFSHRLSNGELRDVEVYVSCADLGDRRLIFSIIHDLTERKRIERALCRGEEELYRKTVQLEEMNTALKVLLSSRETGRKELEESVVTNVRTLVMPHLDMLAASSLGEAQRLALHAVNDHLREIVSPLLPRLSSRFANLSPMELRVARLIKDGRRNKEIALLLGVSENTVLTHRYHLRTKLGLKGNKMNLQTYLASVLDQ